RTLEGALGWRSALLIYGILASSTIFFCCLVFRRTAPGFTAKSFSSSSGVPSLHGRMQAWLLCTGLALSSVATFVIIGHITAYGEERGLNPQLSAILLSTLLGVALVSRLAVSAMQARWGDIWVLLALSAVHLIGVTTLFSSHGLTSILVGIILTGFGFGGYLPSYAVMLSAMVSPQRTTRRISEV